jgi:hypothetical protein
MEVGPSVDWVVDDAKLQNSYVLLGIEDAKSLVFCFVLFFLHLALFSCFAS